MRFSLATAVAPDPRAESGTIDHMCHVRHDVSMTSERVQMNDQGRIVIPAKYRRALGLVGGDELVVRVEDGSLRLQPIDEVAAEAQEVVARYVDDDRSLVDELIAERRQAARAE